MPKTKYQVISALFDIKPVNDAGEINIEKISSVEPLLNLGRKLRIGKSGIAVLKNINKKAPTDVASNKLVNSVGATRSVSPANHLDYSLSQPELKSSKIVDYPAYQEKPNSHEDLEIHLNEDINIKKEIKNIGGKVVFKKEIGKPRYKNSIKYKVLSIKEEGDNDSDIPNIKYIIHNTESEPEYGAVLAQINQKVAPSDNEELIGEPPPLMHECGGEPRRTDIVGWWQEKLKNQNGKVKITESKIKPIQARPRIQTPKIKIPQLPLLKLPTVKLSSKKMIAGGFAAVAIFLFAEYGFSLKNEIVHNGNSAVANLQSAGENIKKLDFTEASTNFTQAYADFAKAGDNLNFMGATMSSLIADLPGFDKLTAGGAGKLKSAKKLVEAGKLMADAGQAMSQAIEELAKTNLILNVGTSDVGIGGISKNLRRTLVLSQKNIKEAGELLEDVDADSLPEDKRASFKEFNSKLPEFEKLITDAVDYSKFLEDFIGTIGTKKYLLLFQNPAELRPTGGFPGTYGVIVFKDGKLQDFKVDDVYNLDGQLKDLYVPPLQLQHITPNWGMRDANWFIDFPTSARKSSEFYKKALGQDVDGVITFSPAIISQILKVTGPIKMEKYGISLNADNFIQAVQEEVEYKADRAQPKKILVDLAPLMLEKIYSADSDKWMEIFNILVSSVDRKDILMYFRDLKLQDFSVTKGFSGQVAQTQDDYLMVTFSNIKGSKTDSVIDSDLKVDSIFEGDDIRHRVVLTRTHNGGGTKFGFFNKQSPTYVRILVPDNAQFLGISGNSRPNFTPLIDYPKTDLPTGQAGFKRDEDLVRFEEKSYFDSETGVTIYEEAGKREYGFWMILNPGETKAVELEYRVPRQGGSSGEYVFYVQKQPGLEFKKFSLDLISGAAEIGQSSVDLKKVDGRYTFTGKLDRDLPVKVIFK